MTNPSSSSGRPSRVPGATYRLQFHAGFTLRDAIGIVPYLDSLGITHLYASPILEARPGSTHGYDVINHDRLNPEVGTDEDFTELAAALRERGMGLILDAVPNHMCVGSGNAWWSDVLEHGPSSPYAGYFDIAWADSPRPQLQGRLLLPVLADQYGTVLESGQLVPMFENGGFHLRYHDTKLPIDPRTFGRFLSLAAADLRGKLGHEHPAAVQLVSILHAVEHLPPRNEVSPAHIKEGRIECSAIRQRLAELPERYPEAAEAIAGAVAIIAGTPGDPASFAPLDELLEAQAYRPCFWRVASDEINYRRFFDVNDLAALSTEREDVFRAVHKTWLNWIVSGLADGLRIDHPDGLFDPKQYLDRLQEHYRLTLQEHGKPVPEGPLYVVVEKILGDGERLPQDWRCDGTTGYEFINAINGLFVDPAGEGPLTTLYERFTGQDETWPEIVYQKKRQVSQSSLASEVNALAHQLDRLARLDRRSRDFTLNGIRKALREVVVCFPVYRSYVNGSVHDSDKAAVGKATRWAYRKNQLLGKQIFDFIRDTVLLKDSPSGPASDEYRSLQRQFAGKFQQVTAPMAAKGTEDTAFYVYNRLTSLNEVGGEPGRFGAKPEAVHVFLAARADNPGGLSPLSTHDTKRGEDVRARLNVLSEIPGIWAERVGEWSEWNRPHKVQIEDSLLAPDANDEYLLYQTFVGAWPHEGGGPEFRDRIQQYMRKALAEAKVHTSWINPDLDYEAAVTSFIDRILDPVISEKFLTDLAVFVERIADFGRINSLAQTLVRCTASGVPDTYQGTEAWDLSLVDPDNRRPVNYSLHAAWLRDLDERLAGSERGLRQLAIDLARDLSDPRAKLFVTALALRCRREYFDVFAKGSYDPLPVSGDKSEHVFAFQRSFNGVTATIVVPRLVTGLQTTSDLGSIEQQVWKDTVVSLPVGIASHAKNVFTGEMMDAPGQLRVAEALGVFPVALLIHA